MSSKPVKTRFCPSPTGYLHLGNVRTALFSLLYAKHTQGVFLLRIEDTDRVRSDEAFTQALMEDMRWLDLHWQEGVDVGGDLGPYYQSQRCHVYDEYFQKLLLTKMVYPCFCSEAELSLQRKLQQKANKPPRYAGTCKKLTLADIAQKEVQGIKPTLRFRMPENETIIFNDLVRGEQKFACSDIGDFVVRRADGTTPFMFGNAIDDALMKVNYVLRGEDHLTNTPRQIAILNALNLPIPTYGHIAMIVGPDNSPLSKRHGSRSLRELRSEGFLPAAIVNYLARLGHYFGHDKFLSIDELAKEFRIEALSKSPAKYNEQQLLFQQTQAVQALSDKAFWHWAGSDIHALVPENHRITFVSMIKPNVQFPQQVKNWAEALFQPLSNFTDEQKLILKAAGANYFSESIIALEQYGIDAAKIVAHLKEKLNIKGKALFQPLRIALTLHEHGPDLANLLLLMNKDEIKNRLELAQQC